MRNDEARHRPVIGNVVVAYFLENNPVSAAVAKKLDMTVVY